MPSTPVTPNKADKPGEGEADKSNAPKVNTLGASLPSPQAGASVSGPQEAQNPGIEVLDSVEDQHLDEVIQSYYALKHGLPLAGEIAVSLSAWIELVNSKPSMTNVEYAINFSRFDTELKLALNRAEMRRQSE